MLVWGIGGESRLRRSSSRARSVRAPWSRRARTEARTRTRMGRRRRLSTTPNGDVVAAVREATDGGADLVIETVGEATWARTLAAVRPAGRVVVCGATSGPTHRRSSTASGGSSSTCWLDDGLARRTSSAPTSLSARAAPGFTSTRCFRCPRPRAGARRLEAGQQPARSSSRFPRSGRTPGGPRRLEGSGPVLAACSPRLYPPAKGGPGNG